MFLSDRRETLSAAQLKKKSARGSTWKQFTFLLTFFFFFFFLGICALRNGSGCWLPFQRREKGEGAGEQLYKRRPMHFKWIIANGADALSSRRMECRGDRGFRKFIWSEGHSGASRTLACGQTSKSGLGQKEENRAPHYGSFRKSRL